MEKEQYRKNAYDMLYLTKCAILDEKPDFDKIGQMDLTALFEVCQKHILTACTAYALESAGVHNHNFTQSKEKAIRKNILLDTEREKILQRLEQEHIWYMSLKGSVLKNWYPKIGMRQMSDNDILCDGAYRREIKDIMLDLGFTCEHYGKGNDDAYFKPPVCNFEMHNELFKLTHVGKLHEYFENIKERFIKDDENEYGYHFRTEDFYIYITAHEYKHYAVGGIGVRSLVDTFVFLKKFGDSLDWDYIGAELTKLELAVYEQQSRKLAMKLFSNETLTGAESEMLDYYIFSGTYGTIENSVENRIQSNAGGSKSRYILHRIFPTMNQIEVHWNFFYRHKWLIPVLWVYRPIHGLFVNRKKIKAELKYLNHKSSES